MILFLVLVVIVLIGLTTAAVMGKISGFMAEPTSSHAFGGVLARSLSSDDVAQLRFDQGLRGYRMDQVDEVIDALRARLSELESQVASSSSSSSTSSFTTTTSSSDSGVGGSSAVAAGAGDVSGEPQG